MLILVLKVEILYKNIKLHTNAILIIYTCSFNCELDFNN
jgi:hypothetical protein